MKLRIKLLLLLMAFVLLNHKSDAQEETTSFSLAEALQYAGEHSYVLQNSMKDVTIAEKQVWETIATGLPQVSGSANYNAFLNLPVTLLPGEFFGEPPGTYVPVKFGQDFSSDFGLSINQLIFDGSYIIGVGSVQLYVNLAKQRYEKSAIDIREAVTQAYYSVLIAQEYKDVMEDNLQNVQKTFNETKILYQNGFREEQDVDQIQLILRNAESEVTKAQREITVAKVVLKYTMGYVLDQEIQLTDSISQFIQPVKAEHEAVQFDYSNHIDYRMAASNFEVSKKLLGIEKVAYLPKLNGFYSYSKNAYGNDANLFKSNVSWYPSSLVGLQMTLSIFNSGQKHSKVQQARIDVEKAENNILLTEQTLQKDYLSAVAQMESALETFDNDMENRELAERIRNKTKIKFDNGISTSTELTQIENQYIDAYRALVTSTLQLLQADLNLKKATSNL